MLFEVCLSYMKHMCVVLYARLLRNDYMLVIGRVKASVLRDGSQGWRTGIYIQV